ncbi:DnaJ domain-containing protein [bacterium]|nr:DnaJ domain-containing protein [bacterium]MCI0565955.1 DnaJ domain-containing protein [bacterium]MCI0679899.1 DnaJ domain-containing protein [bacterium]
MVKTDYYALFGIHPNSSIGVIRAVYKALMSEHHPDHDGDGKTASALGQAYAVLSDTEKRVKYDREREELKGTLFGGEYEIIEMVSDTGLGVIYKARDVLLDEFVCIKHCAQISPQAEEIFLNEARTMRKLRHFGIPSVFRVLRHTDGSLAIVMNWIDGYTLEEVIAKRGGLGNSLEDIEDVAWIAERILNILRYMHTHYSGALHGDIKPGKIMVNNNHEGYLVGFGLSFARGASAERARGYTPYYSPPEAKKGERLYPQSDLYSLGKSMIYALTGDLRAVDNNRIPAKVPVPLRRFIEKLVIEDIARRPRWEWKGGDLFEEIIQLRSEVFKRARSGMRPIV